MNRPTLIPGLPRIWRAPTELQLGTVLLRLPDPRAATLLDLLDGTRPARTVLLAAAERGIPPDDARALLDTLHTAGLTMPAAALVPATRPQLKGEAAALALHGRPTPTGTLRRRESARVVITGRGRLGAALAVALAESGVGHVRPEMPGEVDPGELPGSPLHTTDVGRSRAEAITEALFRAAPGTATHAVRRHPASLVIQLDHDQPTGLVAAAHAQRRQPYLAVRIHEGAAVIGPLVPATGAPCLHCLDLHRRDRDAGWPGLPRAHVPEPCTVTTLLAATAYATAEALAFLDGATPETLGASVELATPGRPRRRTWPGHPDCFCANPGRNPVRW